MRYRNQEAGCELAALGQRALFSLDTDARGGALKIVRHMPVLPGLTKGRLISRLGECVG